jgi:hypothetical protein
VEFEMELNKLKVGQLVEHDNGFTGEIISIEETEGRYTDVNIRVTDQGTSFNEVGSVWTAMPEYINKIVKDVHQFKAVAELEFTGIEKLEELVAQATEALEILAEESVFTAEFGQGIKFEGTKSDYKVFIEGLAELTKTGNEFRF